MSVARATATARRRQQVKAPAARHRQVHPIRRNYLVEQHTTPGLRVDRAFASAAPTATGLVEAPAEVWNAHGSRSSTGGTRSCPQSEGELTVCPSLTTPERVNTRRAATLGDCPGSALLDDT